MMGAANSGPRPYRVSFPNGKRLESTLLGSIEDLFLISILITYYIHLGCTNDILRIFAVSSTGTARLQ